MRLGALQVLEVREREVGRFASAAAAAAAVAAAAVVAVAVAAAAAPLASPFLKLFQQPHGLRDLHLFPHVRPRALPPAVCYPGLFSGREGRSERVPVRSERRRG